MLHDLSRRRLLFVIALVLASLLAAGIASASTVAGAETRVRLPPCRRGGRARR